MGENKSSRFGRNTPKRMGELVEVAFLHKAVSLGFGVAKPYGDSESYDFIVDARQDVAGRLLRVQVKSTSHLQYDAYHLFAGHRTRQGGLPYTSEQIDFLVGYIVPEQIWYVLPLLAFAPTKCLTFYPHRQPKRARYEEYREAWKLMSDSSVPSSSSLSITEDEPARTL
jgi:PD-(D/E)XK endonuclease